MDRTTLRMYHLKLDCREKKSCEVLQGEQFQQKEQLCAAPKVGKGMCDELK